jgi:hypothetical protein
MIQLSHFVFAGTLVFECAQTKRSVEVDVEGDGHDEDWKNEAFVKSVTTLATGKDHTKLRESIEVVDKDGKRLYYLEKL